VSKHRGNQFVRSFPHHTSRHSTGGAVAHVLGTIAAVLADGANTGDGEHQHLRVLVTAMSPLVGPVGDPEDPTFQPNLVGQTLFLAARFGDSDANHGRILFVQDAPIEAQGEFVDTSRARPTAGNDGSDGPILPVLHFTHKPLGFIIFNGQTSE